MKTVYVRYKGRPDIGVLKRVYMQGGYKRIEADFGFYKITDWAARFEIGGVHAKLARVQ